MASTRLLSSGQGEEAPAAAAQPGCASWRSLAPEIVSHLCGFLDLASLRALAGVDHHTAAMVDRSLRVERIAVRTAHCALLSTLLKVLADIVAPGLPQLVQARLLGRLASRMAQLHPGMAAAACQACVDAISRLPASMQAAPLLALLQAWRANPPENVEAALERRLLHLAATGEPDRRAELLTAWVLALSPGALSRHDLLALVDQAVLLPSLQRSVLLVQLLRRHGIGNPALQDPCLHRFLQAGDAMRAPDGRPSPDQGRLLAALARALDRRFAVDDALDEAAAVQAWQAILEAARALPEDLALRVMAELAGRSGFRRPAGVARWEQLWTAAHRAVDGSDARVESGIRAPSAIRQADRLRWLVAMGRVAACLPGLSSGWERLLALVGEQPEPERAMVLGALARRLRKLPDAGERLARWWQLYQMCGALRPACRSAVLAGLAVGLRREAGDPDYPDAVQEADEAQRLACCQALGEMLPPLCPSMQIEVLGACMHDLLTTPVFWGRFRHQLLQLPMQERGAALTLLISRIHMLPSRATRIDAWRDMAGLLHGIPLEHRQECWLSLALQLPTVFDGSSQEDWAQAVLRALLAQQRQSCQQQWLAALAALGNDVALWHWTLRLAMTLPVRLQPLILTRLAQAGDELECLPERALTMWQELGLAVIVLPGSRRGMPLHALMHWYGHLRKAGRRAIAAFLPGLTRDVPAADLPASLIGLDVTATVHPVDHQAARKRLHPEGDA